MSLRQKAGPAVAFATLALLGGAKMASAQDGSLLPQSLKTPAPASNSDQITSDVNLVKAAFKRAKDGDPDVSNYLFNSATQQVCKTLPENTYTACDGTEKPRLRTHCLR